MNTVCWLESEISQKVGLAPKLSPATAQFSSLIFC